MRTTKEEVVDLSEYQDFADAHAQIGRFIEEIYNQSGSIPHLIISHPPATPPTNG
jgi:hypothetical protein